MVKTLVIIDSRVKDYAVLVNQFAAETEYVVLDQDRDGLDQIVEMLAGKEPYESIQIISHGASGSLTLGNSMLNECSLGTYESELAIIGQTLQDGGDLLLYGCNVGAGEGGREFIDMLAVMTGADVAASDDLTSGTTAGGDWELEVTTGAIESVIAVADAGLQKYDHTLGAVDDYILAEMSLVAYQDHPDNLTDGADKDAYDHLKAAEWYILERDYNDQDSFSATVFQHKDGSIVIAYRGTSRGDKNDIKADVAVSGMDHWYSKVDPSFPTLVASLDGFLAAPLIYYIDDDNWDSQFTHAINFAASIKNNYPDAHIEVTGHSLGGSLAEIVSQIFGFSGATFEPGGAANLMSSTEFNTLASQYTNNSNGLGVPASFTNYTVLFSLVSGTVGYTDDHLGTVHSLMSFYSQWIFDNWSSWNHYQNTINAGSVQDLLHDMGGIVELMRAKAVNEAAVFSLFQQKAQIWQDHATATGDIGLSDTPADQGQIEYHSSQLNPYVFANNRDNLIYGHNGNDTIYSFDGSDTVYGGDGNDMISTAQGNDVIDLGRGRDTIYAGSGDDRIEGITIENASSVIDGGSGSDRADIDVSASNNSNSNFEWRIYHGGTYDDLYYFSSFQTIYDVLNGGINQLEILWDSNGRIKFSNVEEFNITGTNYSDLHIYLQGNRYAGGGGTDTFYADWSGVSNSIVWDNDPAATVTLQGAALSGFERLLIATGSGDDEIRNTKVIAATNDYIDTGAGNDVIDGGEGRDTINGGSGSDTVIGGNGIDTVVFSGKYADYIIGYNAIAQTYTVTDQIADRDCTDIISSVENFQFIDGTKSAAISVNDAIPPTVLTFTPPDGATGVDIGSDIVLTFSEAIKRGEGNIALYIDSVSGPLAATYDVAISTNISISGTMLTINPTANLMISQRYFVTFAPGSITDLAGNSYVGSSLYDFTTAAMLDTTPPIVVSFNPSDGATGLSVGSNIVLIFSEAIQKGTGTIAIHTGSETGAIVESYDAAMSTNLTLSGSTLAINPTAALSNSTHYYVTFSEGSVKDLAGNSYAGTTSYDFTTEDLPLTPMIRNGISILPTRYTGPATAAGGEPINFQYIGDGTNEVLIGTANNDFINVSGGVDALDAGAGNDVIDGGTASNFLTGGGGIDIFFSDGRGGVTTWSTITDWQAGEQLSVWGWHPGTSKIIAWVQAGAAGYEGLTMHADLNGDGTIDTSVTFTGIVSQSQLPTPLQFDGVLWFT
jgi:Ca2+-binding RTX toxin-like protein